MTNKILVVDDSSSVRKMVESALRYKGHNVVAVADGVQALESLERDQFDLVIMDINMPRMDGLSVLKTVRERPEWASLPIMMLTSEGQDSDRDRALALGATGYMTKPFKPIRLLERVADILASEE